MAQGFLWRVRRKLTLSYIFIGFVPVLLIVVFFLLCGLLLFFNVSSYLVQSRIRNLTDQARFLAQTVQLEVQRSTSSEQLAETLERRESSMATRYPFVSMVVVPVSNLTCKVEPSQAARIPKTLPATLPMTVGSWAHLPAPTSLPKWIGCEGFSGLVAYNAPPNNKDLAQREQTRLVMRAVALPEVVNPTWAVILDMPMTLAIEQRIQEETARRLSHGAV